MPLALDHSSVRSQNEDIARRPQIVCRGANARIGSVEAWWVVSAPVDLRGCAGPAPCPRRGSSRTSQARNWRRNAASAPVAPRFTQTRACSAHVGEMCWTTSLLTLARFRAPLPAAAHAGAAAEGFLAGNSDDARWAVGSFGRSAAELAEPLPHEWQHRSSS